MNFSAIPLNSRLGFALRYPLRWIPRELVVPVLQGRLRGKRWIVGASVHGCWLGSYEYDKQQRFAHEVRKGHVVYDVGAHVGFYTLLASELVGSEGRVIAFEPLPSNLQYLRRHLALNHATNVEVMEAAVSDQTETMRFDQGLNSSMGYLCPQGNLEVRAVRLDDLYESGLIPTPHIIKMDIEGGEHRALNGARTLLAESRPLVFLSTHGTQLSRQCRDLLEDIGYRISPVAVGINVQEADEFICAA